MQDEELEEVRAVVALVDREEEVAPVEQVAQGEEALVVAAAALVVAAAAEEILQRTLTRATNVVVMTMMTMTILLRRSPSWVRAGKALVRRSGNPVEAELAKVESSPE